MYYNHRILLTTLGLISAKSAQGADCKRSSVVIVSHRLSYAVPNCHPATNGLMLDWVIVSMLYMLLLDLSYRWLVKIQTFQGQSITIISLSHVFRVFLNCTYRFDRWFMTICDPRHVVVMLTLHMRSAFMPCLMLLGLLKNVQVPQVPESCWRMLFWPRMVILHSKFMHLDCQFDL